MRSAKKFLWAILLLPVLLANTHTTIASDDVDDYTPDVTARVARISVLRGEAQIRHSDSQDWERVTTNLPIVEGDEIATDADSRLEIQFNKDNYLRLSENAYLKVTTLRDDGIALSLPNGTLSLRVLNFDKDRTFFEIDAPKSTVAVQKSGMYRIDAGDRDETKVRVTVTDDGLARIYTDNSGFTLRSGRSSELQLAGNYAGEWDTGDASRYTDDFNSWALQRDAVVAKRLRDAHYDQYYDRDIYGAEDLNGYGDWIYTKKYGYVWKPYGSTVSSYDDWSPYRYGQWRWIPPYGWTWVNDEPWGWATYHHGRWVYDNDWYWSPYSQYRSRRSWWSPALVVVSYIGSNICWYPLPYDYGYYNYNRSTYVDRRRYNTTIINNTTVINPTPTPIQHDARTKALLTKLTLAKVPKSAVVSVAESEFGRGKNFQKTPPELAAKVLSKTPSELQNPPILPTRRDLNGKISKEIRAESPKIEKIESRISTGAMDRKIGDSMDKKLRTERIYGDRAPVGNTKKETRTDVESSPPIRDTGAVKRVARPTYKQENNNSDTKTSPAREMSPPIRSTGGKSDNTKDAQPVFRPRKQRDDIEKSPPIYETTPPRRETREIKPPPSAEQPPKRQEPRPQPPPREAKPPKSEPPPRKADPIPIDKTPTPSTEGKGRRNDKDN